MKKFLAIYHGLVEDLAKHKKEDAKELLKKIRGLDFMHTFHVYFDLVQILNTLSLKFQSRCIDLSFIDENIFLAN